MRALVFPTTRFLSAKSIKPQPLGLSRKFAPYTPQFQNQNKMTRRTFITEEMLMAFAGMLVGAGAIGGGIITIIGRYIYGRSKTKYEKEKKYDELIKEIQLKEIEKTKQEKFEFEEFKKDHEEFKKYKQEKASNKKEDI